MITSTKTPSVLDSVFTFIKSAVNSPLQFDQENYDLSFNNNLGKGNINGTQLKDGMSLLQFDVTFNNQFSFQANFDNTDILTFGYCSLGGLKYSSNNLNSSIAIDNFQTVIFNNSTNTDATLTFEKDKTTKMSLILINKEAEFNEYNYDFKSQLYDIFKTDDLGKDFIFVSSYNLKISEQIVRLNSIEAESIVKKIMTESIVYNILGLELQQHLIEKSNSEQSVEGLSKYDYKTIKEISTYLKDNPELPHSINNITSKFGISALKLQTGFKSLHNATFLEHLKNLRLEKAEVLLRTTDANISDAVYSVGFTSRSYFSKIFKARYNCSPRHFKKSLSMNYKLIA